MIADYMTGQLEASSHLWEKIWNADWETSNVHQIGVPEEVSGVSLEIIVRELRSSGRKVEVKTEDNEERRFLIIS